MPMQSIGKTANARMWVYLGDDLHPYNVFDFTLNRGRDGPKYFLKDYRQVLLADVTEDTTAWWPAMRSRAQAVGHICAAR